MDWSAITDWAEKASEAESGQEERAPWGSLLFLAWNTKDRKSLRK